MRNKVILVPQLPYLARGGAPWRLRNQLLGQHKLVRLGYERGLVLLKNGHRLIIP